MSAGVATAAQAPFLLYAIAVTMLFDPSCRFTTSDPPPPPHPTPHPPPHAHPTPHPPPHAHPTPHPPPHAHPTRPRNAPTL
jgi:hypothetical protein